MNAADRAWDVSDASRIASHISAPKTWQVWDGLVSRRGHGPAVGRGAAHSAVPPRLVPVPRALVPALTAPAPVSRARAWNRACTRAPCALRQVNKHNLAQSSECVL